MFELQRLQGPNDRGIALQTRQGRDIANCQGAALTEMHQSRNTAFLNRYGSNWQERRGPVGYYNCAGHVWASRRTCIYEDVEWWAVLSDDGYRKTRHPVPDDLGVYVDDDPQVGILHIARVVDLRQGVSQESPKIPWLVSKWNDWTGEVLHFEHDHPYQLADGFSVRVEYWTDRLATREGLLS